MSLAGGDVLALYGELGTGKTLLVRGIASGLGAEPGSVSSPTFVLVHEYAGRLPLAHADLFRVTSRACLDSLGLWEYADRGAALAIEWADRAGAGLPADRLDVHMTHRGVHSRLITMTARGAASAGLLARFADRIGRLARRRTGARVRRKE
jgi:tRNA threonylcarbamoyladenosine biosynthesis protein TsaE